MAAASTEKPVTLRILIDEEKNKVVYAQAGKDFVDILLSFLTLPLGTIARLVAKESEMKKVNVGSLNNLYESVPNLDVEHFWTETCKEMLLQPRNSMEDYCQNLKINIDDTEKLKFFICENRNCLRREAGSMLSIFKDIKCKCGELINREILPKIEVRNHEGFVQDMDSFIIFDNLKMVDLLKCSLLSETPLTDFFLRKKQFHDIAQPRSAFVHLFLILVLKKTLLERR
ncbi:unnamed protein product [Lupinus luteus]|uniref:DUF674 family protein n=1 Tax=Lupinus luteus TaxID=3873 RepID=A0AAV1W5E8_LUPLU